MRVILHVGAHKTGTSLIQKYFRDRVADLQGSGVVAIPRSDTNRLIGWGEKVVETPRRLRRRLEAELRLAPESLLVSHENSLGRPFVEGRPGVYPAAGELAAALSEACSGLGAEVVVVFYIRPMADFVESYYLQSVHEGSWHTFDEWYSHIDSDQLSWQPIVDALEAAFGADNTLIGDFSEISAGQTEFLEGFMQRTGIRRPRTVRYEPRRNASISRVGLEIALNVNPHLETKQQRVASRKFLQEHFSNATGDRARPLPTAERDRLTAVLASEYASLAERSRLALRS